MVALSSLLKKENMFHSIHPTNRLKRLFGLVEKNGKLFLSKETIVPQQSLQVIVIGIYQRCIYLRFSRLMPHRMFENKIIILAQLCFIFGRRKALQNLLGKGKILLVMFVILSNNPSK